MSGRSLKGVDFRTQIALIRSGELTEDTPIVCPRCDGTKEVSHAYCEPGDCPCGDGTVPYAEIYRPVEEYQGLIPDPGAGLDRDRLYI